MSVQYTLTKTKRKTICIIVHKDASIEVRAPLKMKQADIERFVNSKKSWIIKNQSKIPIIDDITYESTIPFLGKERIITPYELDCITLSENTVYLPQNLNNKELVSTLNQYLKTQAKQYIPQRTKQLADTVGIHPSTVQINSAKTHWGSCTVDRLHFSCYLMLADKKVIDYVIIHELSHILHHNHSKQFWAEVEKHCPDYINLRNRLKQISVYVEKLQIK